MKGLEQAVNIKLWPGNGEPVKPWGKLKRVWEFQPPMPSAKDSDLEGESFSRKGS